MIVQHFWKHASSLRCESAKGLRIAQIRGGGFDPSIFSGMVLGYLLARLVGESISLYTHYMMTLTVIEVRVCVCVCVCVCVRV
jgi:hypothetical protein